MRTIGLALLAGLAGAAGAHIERRIERRLVLRRLTLAWKAAAAESEHPSFLVGDPHVAPLGSDDYTVPDQSGNTWWRR